MNPSSRRPEQTARDRRNGARDRSERCPQSIGITARNRRNPQRWPSGGAHLQTAARPTSKILASAQ